MLPDVLLVAPEDPSFAALSSVLQKYMKPKALQVSEYPNVQCRCCTGHLQARKFAVEHHLAS